MKLMKTPEVREARARAGRIRLGMKDYLTTLALIAQARDQEDWKTLGYDSWAAYVDGEFGAERLQLAPEHRQKAVQELRMAGLSTREIGAAVGYSHTEVRRQLAAGGTNVPPDTTPEQGKDDSSPAREQAGSDPLPGPAPDSPAGLPTTASGPDLPPGQPGPSTSTEDGRAVARPGPLPPATEADEAPIGDGEAPVGAGESTPVGGDGGGVKRTAGAPAPRPATAGASAAVDALTSGVPIAPASGVGAAPPAPREGRAGGVTPVERMKAIAEQMFADGSVASVPDLVTVLAYLAVAVRSVPVDRAAAEDREVWAGDLSRIAASLQIFAKSLIE